MEGIRLRLTARDCFGYVLAYVFWLLALALGALALFGTRNAFNTIWPLFGTDFQWRWILRAVDRFGLVFLGVVWLVYELFVESHYRSAITAVRVREFKGRKAPALQDGQANWATRWLARMGLDVLVPRFVTTISPLIAVYLVSSFAKWLAFQSLLR